MYKILFALQSTIAFIVIQRLGLTGFEVVGGIGLVSVGGAMFGAVVADLTKGIEK